MSVRENLFIRESVGNGGVNRSDDVRHVQELLNRFRHSSMQVLDVDGVSTPRTISTIRAFQRRYVGMRSPDGRVDPGGRTLRVLILGSDTQLSGATWWWANEATYPNSVLLTELASPFRENAQAFVTALREATRQVDIGTTRRDVTRAHIMHYSWEIARLGFNPANVPSVDGLNIRWDHGNVADSRRGAREMVSLFNMAVNASLTSNHIAGLAIDMTIEWDGTLRIRTHDGEMIDITSTPRTGADNDDLHAVGAAYGVIKYTSTPPDPPHWSHDGH